MKYRETAQMLRMFDRKGRYVFTKHDMSKLFQNDNIKALDEGLNRLVKTGLLRRACRGVYINANAQCFDSYTIEHIAKALRRNAYSYISLESMLSEYGVISQIPLDRLTVMTTGRTGFCKTEYGVIEFTHTKRSISNILDNTQIVRERPLRIATQETALRDLRRVGRNLHLLQLENSQE
jgi:predicted transcriptional regulator of viral defense system